MKCSICGTTINPGDSYTQVFGDIRNPTNKEPHPVCTSCGTQKTCSDPLPETPLRQRFRHKPTLVQAYQNKTQHPIEIDTPHGKVYARPKDWVIQIEDGVYLFPRTNELFHQSYDRIINEGLMSL